MINCILFSVGREALGFSGPLNEPLSFARDSDRGKQWSPILQWKLRLSPGFYSYGINTEGDGKFRTQPEGIYFVSSSMIIEYESQMNFSACFKNFDSESCEICSLNTTLINSTRVSKGRTTVTMNCFLQLDAETEYGIFVRTLESFTLLGGSTFAIQLIGIVGTTPGLTLPVKLIESGAKNEEENEYSIEVDRGKLLNRAFFNSLKRKYMDCFRKLDNTKESFLSVQSLVSKLPLCHAALSFFIFEPKSLHVMV